MATGVNQVVTRGYGLSPGSVKFIPARGYVSAAAAPPAPSDPREVKFIRHYGGAVPPRQQGD